MSQRWRMVVWGAGLVVGLCFGRRRRGTVEEGEGVYIFSQKWFSVLEVKNTSMTINNIKQNNGQYRYTTKTTNTKQSQQTQEYPQV